jgi:hypothetical protein
MATPSMARHAHHVFFTLNDASPAARERLVRDCYEYLKGHDGVVALSAGTRAEGCDRDVNDLAFHVSLHMEFRDQASHDAYQTAPRHMEFVQRNQPNWKTVRVFDSTLAESR